MGCLCSREDDSKSVPEEYISGGIMEYDDPNKADPKDYTISSLTDETIIRLEGTVNGEQFQIENCTNCDIYIFDVSAQITIDNCTNCRFMLGPCESSVYFRNCTDCKFVLACRQLRTRDSKNIDLMLYCATRPTIEATSNVRISCYQFSYFSLLQQFKKAKLSRWTNPWSDVHDFSCKNKRSTAVTYLPPSVDVWNFLDKNKSYEDEYDAPSPIPRTTGLSGHYIASESKQCTFIVAMNEDTADKVWKSIYNDVVSGNITIKLCSEVELSNAHVKQLCSYHNDGDSIVSLGELEAAERVIGIEMYYHNEDGMTKIRMLVDNKDDNDKFIYYDNGNEASRYFFDNCQPNNQI